MTLPPDRFRRFAALILGVLAFATCTFAQDEKKDDSDEVKAAKVKAEVKAIFDELKPDAKLKKVKDKLAADPAGSRFRLDKLEAGDKALVVHGVMLVPGIDDAERDAAEKAAGAAIGKAAREVAGTGFEEFVKFSTDSQEKGSVKAVRGEKQSPHLLLQKAANEAGENAADELQLTDSRFDAEGRLVISGLSGRDPKTIAWLGGAVKDKLKENAAALGTDGAPRAAFILTPPKEGAVWPLSPTAIQTAIAGANGAGPVRVRVDRAYLVCTSVKADKTNNGQEWTYTLSGVVLGKNQPDAAAIDAACDRALTAQGWPPLKRSAKPDGTPVDLTFTTVDDPGPKFQKAIAARTSTNLDGVRLDDRTEFGPDGKLVLIGLQPGLDAQGMAELNTVVREVLALPTESDKTSARTLAARGISTDKLEKVKVRELYAELRRWVADNLDDVRLSRLYFNEVGGLTLLFEAPSTPNVKPKVTEQLNALMPKFIPAAKSADPTPPKATTKEPEKKEPDEKKETDEKKDGAGAAFVSPTAARLAAQPTPTAPPQAPTVEFKPFKSGLTQYLQQVVSDTKTPKWEAVLIERGFFNEKNEYTVRGVVDTEKQKTQLVELLDSLKDDSAWAAYFKPMPAAAPELEVIPMAKLVDRVRRVMPAYPAFDGIRIVRARYESDAANPGQTLVFDAHIVGRPDKTAVAKLRALIAEDKEYFGRRLPKNRDPKFVKEAGVVLANDQLGDFSIGYGATALARNDFVKAKEWIDAGMLHYPNDASMWFLSAYYNHVTGDRELARRDLYRMIETEGRLEFDGGVARKRRYLAAKDIQGTQRDELEKLWLEYWKESKDGGQPIKLTTGK